MIFHFFMQNRNKFSLFVTYSPCQLKQKIRRFPGKCQKLDLVYNTIAKKELPRSVGGRPRLLLPAKTMAARRSCLTAVAEFPGKCYS